MIKLAVVENDDDERFFMIEAFEAFGNFDIVGQFANGDQLMQWLDQGPAQLPQLIVTDLNMPGKNGYDVISEVKDKYPGIWVIATSTSSIPATRDKCRSLGAREFMVKPDVFIAYDRYVGQVYELVGPELAEN